MRVFQNIFVYSAYLRRLTLSLCAPGVDSFESRRSALIDDRYCSVHYLEGQDGSDVFLLSNEDGVAQRAWANENGMKASTSSHDILLAQIEAHRSEVFYTQDPGRYGPDFLSRLPQCVRVRVAWQSPPAPPGDLTGYDLVVNNFPASLRAYGEQGVKTAYFTPSHDPKMPASTESGKRPIDVAFVGGYTRHHRRRAAVLESVAGLASSHRILFALDRSRLTRLAESPLGRLAPLASHRRPRSIRAVGIEPLYGREMYDLFAQAKIVLNGAVDAAGEDRGNMRCFEALGCGALLLTDAGSYPEGMVDTETMRVYRDPRDAWSAVQALLHEPERCRAIAARGLQMIQARYSKAAQWRNFVGLVGQA